ncbi:MAG: 5-formyltetrahydrofolate cyclo-ligase [Ornithinimicrobium sp.]|uniref:5-formyltetrahydrofolate cyclo-ligase n=1 Tax=Ornithinimicrobium sp. TaxID=1977084 RepID=UPI003D9B12D6
MSISARAATLTQAAVARSRGSEVLQGVDVALIPALAVSRDGRRLGQGGGYYDRVLPVLRQRASTVPVIAVLHDHEWLPQVPSEPHDALVDAVLTTAGVQDVEGLTPPA